MQAKIKFYKWKCVTLNYKNGIQKLKFEIHILLKMAFGSNFTIFSNDFQLFFFLNVFVNFLKCF